MASALVAQGPPPNHYSPPTGDTTMHQRMAYERGAKELTPSRIRRFDHLRPGLLPGHEACGIRLQGSIGHQDPREGLQPPARHAHRPGRSHWWLPLRRSHAVLRQSHGLIVGAGLDWLCAGTGTPALPSSFRGGPAEELA